ncbi:MAG: hypothetical protein NVSMB62_15970 [Acidobacteriaceae bacterium]
MTSLALRTLFLLAAFSPLAVTAQIFAPIAPGYRPAVATMAALSGANDDGSPETLPVAPTPNLSGVVRGRVLYTDSTPVGSAALTLTPASGPALHTTTEADGSFTFFHVDAGPFRVDAAADGLQADSIADTLSGTGSLELPALSLRVATVVTQVSAISQEEAAERDVRQEETQRLFGAIPNFFIVYGGEAVPLSPRQKFRLSLRTLFDPSNIAVSAAIAGGEQASGSYGGFGKGPAGFARRFGASFGDASSGILLTSALLPSVFHQDPRYFYRGTGSIRSRFGYVLKNSVEQKGDSGRWQFGWSNIVGNAGAALISNTYYPNQTDKWATLTGENFGLSVAGQGIANLLQEFVFARLTTHRQP